METKKCTKCGEVKSLDCFSKSKKCKNGIRSYCKSCGNLSSKEWRESNEEKSRKYREQNVERIKLNVRNWRKNNKEAVHVYRERGKELRAKSNWAYKRSPALFSRFETDLSYVEELRENEKGILEVKCAYCGRWMVASNLQCQSRVQSLKGNAPGECRFYCSDGCKQSCPIFGRVVHYKGQKIEKSSREVQPELRQMALLRDSYTCQSCGVCGECVQLHVHHIKAVVDDPIESADLDNVVTLCKDCHKKAHSKEGCGYNDLNKSICGGQAKAV